MKVLDFSRLLYIRINIDEINIMNNDILAIDVNAKRMFNAYRENNLRLFIFGVLHSAKSGIRAIYEVYFNIESSLTRLDALYLKLKNRLSEIPLAITYLYVKYADNGIQIIAIQYIALNAV